MTDATAWEAGRKSPCEWAWWRNALADSPGVLPRVRVLFNLCWSVGDWVLQDAAKIERLAVAVLRGDMTFGAALEAYAEKFKLVP